MIGVVVMKNVKLFLCYILGKEISVNYYVIKKFGFVEYVKEIEVYVLYGVLFKIKLILDIIIEFI